MIKGAVPKKTSFFKDPYSVYTLKCPSCNFLNQNDAVRCWNCGYWFLKEDNQSQDYKTYFYFVLFLVLLLFALWVGIFFYLQYLVK